MPPFQAAAPFEDTLNEVTGGEGVLAVALDGRIVAWEPVADAAGPLAEIIEPGHDDLQSG